MPVSSRAPYQDHRPQRSNTRLNSSYALAQPAQRLSFVAHRDVFWEGVYLINTIEHLLCVSGTILRCYRYCLISSSQQSYKPVINYSQQILSGLHLPGTFWTLGLSSHVTSADNELHSKVMQVASKLSCWLPALLSSLFPLPWVPAMLRCSIKPSLTCFFLASIIQYNFLFHDEETGSERPSVSLRSFGW